MGKDKKKRKTVTYIDDGRTVADMSCLGRRPTSAHKGTLKEQANTFFTAMRMMFIPMMVTIGIICIAFFVAWLLLLA